jgi:hypothetical protein
MDCEKTGGGSFSIRVLSESIPMVAPERAVLLGTVVRYILREAEESPVEYVDAETGQALLPQYRLEIFPGFWHEVSGGSGPFSEQGTLLGQMLALREWSDEGEFPPLGEPLVLKLDRGLLVGTGRNFRDTLDHRIAGTEDYPYRRFTKEEYDEMIEVGMNYFMVDPEQAEWIRRRPVFYEQRDLKGVRFPEILYRSNYMGAVQFVDEPGVYIYGDQDAKEGVTRPADLGELLGLRVRRTLRTAGGYSSLHLDELLRAAGFNLGSMQVLELDIPIWETMINTSFYQLESQAAAGIIHEGRYRLSEFRNDLKKLGFEAEWIREKEMLLFYYAFLRGAARAAWEKDWGMSIYGQADPAISPLAVTLAYDLGARYIWYWTSDHQHHLPYQEQLGLTRHLRAHQKAHPRQSRKELLKAARVAIAIPYGYVIDFGPLWASNDFAHDKLNDAGVDYGTVVKAAVKEALACLKKGESFDLVVENLGLPAREYERIIHVRPDGTAGR